MLDARSEIGEGLSPEWLSRPAVTICPEWALRARGALGVVDAFLVWAANDAIDQDHRFCCVSRDELADLARDPGVRARILVFGKPTLQRVSLRAFTRDDPDSDFGRGLIIGTIERHSGQRITAEAAPRMLLERPKRLVEHALTSASIRLTPAVTGREASNASPRSGALRS